MDSFSVMVSQTSYMNNFIYLLEKSFIYKAADGNINLFTMFITALYSERVYCK